MNRKPLIVLLCFALVMPALSVWGWITLPADARVPMHWNIQGEVDGWGSKSMALGFTPLMTAFVIGVILLARKFDPRKEHLEQSKTALQWIVMAIAGFMTFIHGIVLLAATGYEVNVVASILTGVGLIFCLIGNFLGKIRSNFMAGVRTPWTLSSEKSWSKTNRLAGRVLVVTGLCTALAAIFTTPAVATTVLLTGVFGGLVGCVAYSYLVWKNDPERSRN